MHRNLDRRVEALIRIKNPDMTAELMDLVKLEASPQVRLGIYVGTELGDAILKPRMARR